MPEGPRRPSFSEDPSRLHGQSELFHFTQLDPGRAFFLRNALKQVCAQPASPLCSDPPYFTRVRVAGKVEEAFVQHSGGKVSYVLFREEGLYYSTVE